MTENKTTLALIHKHIPFVEIEDGEAGNAKIDHFTIEEDDHKVFHYGARAPEPGTYTRLTVDGVLMMTDTWAEKMDHSLAVARSTGDVLVTGLGLGMVANAMALRDTVKSVTVIENSEGVIELVKSSLHEKVEVIHADAFTWEPGDRGPFDFIWHDVWPDICSGDNPARAAMIAHYGPHCAGEQRCWGDPDETWGV